MHIGKPLRRDEDFKFLRGRLGDARAANRTRCDGHCACAARRNAGGIGCLKR
jgi:hypothetical protein